MKKLDVPKWLASDVFDLCLDGISDGKLKLRLKKQKAIIESEYAKYEQHSKLQTWCDLKRAQHGKKEQLVIGDITKGEFVHLYEIGMVNSRCGARGIYDAIKLQARNECPYCGGCGEIISVDTYMRGECEEEEEIGTIDHFLPKASFPAFSIFPPNLVPSCGVCNSGMGAKFPEIKSKQPLHPYFDAAYFFDEKWTTAMVLEGDPVVVTFGVQPPEHWSVDDKSRIANHFKGCKLRSRYRVKAIPDITALIDQRKTVYNKLSTQGFREIIQSIAENEKLPINGWKRTLHHGLAESDWFCRNKF